MESDPIDTYDVRVVSVHATHWRRDGKATTPERTTFDLGDRLAKFYRLFEGQLPGVLGHQRISRIALGKDGERRPATPESGELFLFALPFPANQVVAALVLDFRSPDLNVDRSMIRSVLESAADGDVRIDDRDLAAYIEDLCLGLTEMRKVKGPQGEAFGLPIERHQLVFVGHLGGTAPPEPEAVASILYDVTPPYRAEFVSLVQPNGLNQRTGTFAAVTANASLLYGHPDEIETSVFLTTVQAVGTASRFQQIWQDAYAQVTEFQLHKQARESGVQERSDLEQLADEMGNLELDLAFSVEAAADLGAPIPSYSIVTFHDKLYEVMQIRARARTVSQMFVRLGGSIRSELTAIESRERQEEESRRLAEENRRRGEEKRRLRAAVAFGFVSFVAIPIGFVLAFFGINAEQIHPGASIWNLHYYLGVYVVAGVLAVLPAIWLTVVYAPTVRPHLGRFRRGRD